jgi:hypothetical protein
MNSPSLHLVPDADAPALHPAPDSVAQQIKRLQGEIKALSAEQATTMRGQVLAGVDLARDVMANPSQPEGVRQLAERIAREGESICQTLDQIVGRVS